MNEHPKPELLALYATGDAGWEHESELKSHLPFCSSCREALAEFEIMQHLWRSSVPEPLQSDLEWLRRGIRVRLEPREQSVRSWLLGAIPTAAAIILLVTVTLRNTPVSIPQEDTLRLPLFIPSTRLTLSFPEPKRAVSQKSRIQLAAGLRAVNFVASGDGAVQMRLTTADPNVVILLPPVESASNHED